MTVYLGNNLFHIIIIWKYFFFINKLLNSFIDFCIPSTCRKKKKKKSLLRKYLHIFFFLCKNSENQLQWKQKKKKSFHEKRKKMEEKSHILIMWPFCMEIFSFHFFYTHNSWIIKSVLCNIFHMICMPFYALLK